MRSQVCQLNMGTGMETSWMWTPFPLTTDKNRVQQTDPLSLFDITVEDTVTVFKQIRLIETLQIKLQRFELSLFSFQQTWLTHRRGHAESEDPSTIPCHWDTEGKRRLSLLTQQLNTRSKGFILNYRHGNKQTELNWSLQTGFLKTNAHLRKVHPKALKLSLIWEAHKKQVKL